MTDASGWTYREPPFHAGEQAVQRRLGVRENAEHLARRVIRDYLPVDAPVGILGIMPEVRRRNRLTGRIASHGDDDLHIAVEFDKDNSPSAVVAGYWSVILVDLPDYRVVPNDLNRFNFNAYSLLQRSEDGGVSIVVAPAQSGAFPASKNVIDQRRHDADVSAAPGTGHRRPWPDRCRVGQF